MGLIIWPTNGVSLPYSTYVHILTTEIDRLYYLQGWQTSFNTQMDQSHYKPQWQECKDVKECIKALEEAKEHQLKTINISLQYPYIVFFLISDTSKHVVNAQYKINFIRAVLKHLTARTILSANIMNMDSLDCILIKSVYKM